MNSKLSLLLSTFFHLTIIIPVSAGTNPPGTTCSGGGGGCDSSVTTPSHGSLEWGIKVGLARYPKPTTLTDFGQAAYELNGNLPDFKQIYGRYFSSSPLQQREIHLELYQPKISAATFHPSCLFLQSEAVFETLKKSAADGYPQFIHQILTDDSFTLIDVLPAPESGWRLRIWRRDAAALTQSGGFYVTTDFEDPTKATPLYDVVFKRPTGSSDDNTLIYIQKETTGLAGTRTITNEIVQTLGSNGTVAEVDSKTYHGEGTAGPLLKKELLTYTKRGTQPSVSGLNLNSTRIWDYTIERKVLEASVDPAGGIGALTLTASTLENYDDYTPVYHDDDGNIYGSMGGALGMKRLMSLTTAYNVPGQTAQTTTYTYIEKPLVPTIHGRLQSTVRPDGSWTYNEYTIYSDSPVSIIKEYSGWKDLTMDQRADARITVTEISANQSVIETSIAGKLISKSRTTLGEIAGDPITTAEQWDGNAWHITTTAYYPESAPAPSTGRIKWIENSDGTLAAYVYAIVDGQLLTTVSTGAGSREAVIAGLAEGSTNGISAGTQVQTTFHAMHYMDAKGQSQYGIRDFPIAQVTNDIASGLITEQWTTDLTYHSGFDQLGRPIKRIYNADLNDYDISQYACCGLEFSRDRMGATTHYFRDGLKRVYKTESKASAASPVVSTFTTTDGLTTTTTRRIGDSASQFLGSTTRSLDGLTTITTGPSRKSTAVADRPVTTSVIARSATGDTVTTTHPDLSKTITASYLDGQTKSVTGSAVADMSYAYDTYPIPGSVPQAHGLTTAQNASGVITTTFTDLLGRTAKTESGATGTTTHTYYPLTAPDGSRGKLQSVTDGDEVTITYGYNAEGERTTTSRLIPLAGNTTATQVTTTERDVVPDVTLHGVSLGISYRTTQTVASTGIAAVTTSQSFASIGGLVSGASSFGSQTLNIATRPDASGIATRTSIRPDGTQSVQTTTHGLVTTVQEKSTTGSVITGTSYTYDFFHRPETVTDLRTGPVTYSNFTEAGQPLTVTTNGNTDVTTTENDIMGRTIQTTLPDTTVKHTAYHPTGQVKATWGSQTYPTWNIYDEQGRQTQLHTWKIAPTLNPATIHLPTTITPPADSDVTTWIYGPATGRLDRKQYADGKGTNYTYTDAGRLESRAWARGITTTYGYEYGLMTSTDYSDTTPDVTITYEPLGRQETVTQTNQSQITYTYDPANLALDTETIKYDLDHDGTYEFTRVLDRSRDSLQRDNGWQLKDGSTIENQATYGYHATEGRLLTVADAANTFTYGYVGNSNLVHTVTATAGAVHTVTNTWEPNRNVLDAKQNKVGTDIVSRYDYTVNSIGQRTALATSGTAFPAMPSWLWGYDSLGQVTSADSSVNTSDRAYEYDAIGNRKKFADSLTLPTNDNYVANSLNQYTAGTTATAVPVHDFDGNATAYPLPVAPSVNSALGWDAENRLVSATVGSSTKTTLYDALSRRIAETMGTRTTLYVYDGWNCIAEYQLQNSTFNLHTSRLWGMDLSGSMQGAGGVGGILSESQIVNSQISSFYPTFDGNGNVSEYLDSTGQVTAHFEYDPFGNTVVNTNTNNQFAYRFSTKPLDSTTGLYYYGYRYYDPVTGRWPSRDPIEERGGLNLYEFVRNDGVSKWDILGRITATNNCPSPKIKDPVGVQNCLDKYNAALKVHNDKLWSEYKWASIAATSCVAWCIGENLLSPQKAIICMAKCDTAYVIYIAKSVEAYEKSVEQEAEKFQACIDAVSCICPVCNGPNCIMD